MEHRKFLDSFDLTGCSDNEKEEHLNADQMCPSDLEEMALTVVSKKQKITSCGGNQGNIQKEKEESSINEASDESQLEEKTKDIVGSKVFN